MTFRAVVYDFHRTLALPPGGTLWRRALLEALGEHAASADGDELGRVLNASFPWESPEERREHATQAGAREYFTGLLAAAAIAGGIPGSRAREAAIAAYATIVAPESHIPYPETRDVAHGGRRARAAAARPLEPRLGAARDLPVARLAATAHRRPHLGAARGREAASRELRGGDRRRGLRAGRDPLRRRHLRGRRRRARARRHAGAARPPAASRTRAATRTICTGVLTACSLQDYHARRGRPRRHPARTHA